MSAFDAGLSLETPRLRLRAVRGSDAPALLEIFADPAVARYGSSPPWADLAEAERRVARDLQGGADGSVLALLVERAADARVIGRCVLFHVDRGCRRAEVGYALASSAWGQGYAREAVQALLDYGFEHLDLNRVEADIDPRNTASARLLERLGFRAEGLLRERWIVAGEVSDSAMYGLLRAEWSAQPAR